MLTSFLPEFHIFHTHICGAQVTKYERTSILNLTIWVLFGRAKKRSADFRLCGSKWGNDGHVASNVIWQVGYKRNHTPKPEVSLTSLTTLKGCTAGEPQQSNKLGGQNRKEQAKILEQLSWCLETVNKKINYLYYLFFPGLLSESGLLPYTSPE